MKAGIKKHLLSIYFQLRKIRLGLIIKFRLVLHKLIGKQLFDFNKFQREIINYITSMQTDSSGVRYLYSGSCTKPTLYSSAYACMTLNMLGKLQNYDSQAKLYWVDYFNSFQNPKDGLFYDEIVRNDLYDDTDWWGARHLALHMISAYTDLGSRPKFPFTFLQKYYQLYYTGSWLDSFNWEGEGFDGANDIDNKIMNISCLLQYQRDYWNDPQAGKAVDFIKKYLKDKLDKSTGMWGAYDIENPSQLSRMVQFAYHLFLIYFYDNDYDFDHERIVQLVLKTQNKYGGYGVPSNSSACEDIDSINLLIKFYDHVPRLQQEIDQSLHKSMKWVMCNQTNGTGFVFQLYFPMVYGHKEMSSGVNEPSLFPTWFRTLSIAYLARHFSIGGFSDTSNLGVVQNI
jgi:hypothetical protein